MNFGRMPLPGEFKLLVECCRRGFAGEDSQLIAELAREADWDRFVTLSRRHRVQGLVWHGLREVVGKIPTAAAAVLSQDASAVAEQNLRAARFSQRLFESFTAAGVPLLFVKGLTLSKLAYGDPFLKMGWDVDVLVPADSVAAAAAELERLDFVLVVPSPKAGPRIISKWHRRRKESVWRSSEGLHVELHTRLADSHDLIPSIGMGSAQQQVEMAPGITLPTLALDDLFAYLCVHGASSAWFRLKWITDLAALLHPLTPQQIERLYDHSQHMCAGRAADQALILASRIYGTPVGPDLLRRLSNSRTSRWLSNTAWNELMRDREPTQVRLGTVPIHLTQLFLRPGIRYRINEAARQVFDWASPLR